MPLFDSCSHVLVLDAMDIGLKPGQWDVIDVDPSGAGESGSHGGGVDYLLKAVNAVVSPLPEIAVLGIQIEKVGGFSPVLSEPVTASLNGVVEAVLGLAVSYKTHPAFSCAKDREVR